MRESGVVPERDASVLRHVGGGRSGGCGFGTPDGPCPNAPVTTVAMAAAHPADGSARWVVEAWTPVCGWHRDAAMALVRRPDVPGLWRERDAAALPSAPLADPMRAGTARWLGANADAVWAGELGL
jgi:hypothetical protein